MAELELERQKGRLLPVEQVREAIRELGAILRRVGQTLERQEWLQGSEARQRIEEGLDEFERLAVRKFGPDASDAPQDDQSAAQ